MSLRVTCACGKSFNAQEKLAGKTVSCPACGGSLTIPRPAAAPVHASASDTIRVACACGKTLNAKSSLAGKKVKCPACSSTVAIPSARVAASVSNEELGPLDNFDPLSNDPLDLGGFDEQAFAAAPAAKLTPNPLGRKPADSAAASSKMKLAWTIGGSVGVVTLTVILFVTVILPGIRKGNEIADAESGGPVSDPSLARRGLNIQPPPGVPATPPDISPSGMPPGGIPNVPVEWTTFTSQEYGYSVLLPGTPRERKETISGAPISIAVCDIGSAAYVVVAQRPPPEIAAHPGFRIVDTMDALISALIKRDQGEELSRKNILYQNRAAREVTYNATIEGRKFRASARFVVADKTIYSLICFTSGEPGPDLQKFLDSLKIANEYSPSS